MHWRFPGRWLYRADASRPGARIGCADDPARQPDGVRPKEWLRLSGERVDMADVDYRSFVEACAFSEEPSGVILNRSAAHAAVVLEYLFRSAERRVRILTNQLSSDVYGLDGVVAAAVGFLRDHPAATIDILAEQRVDRAAHPLLTAADAAGQGARLSLRFVPGASARYQFNFAVADGVNYRFEESRENREAIVQFRDGDFARDLDALFEMIKQSSVDQLP